MRLFSLYIVLILVFSFQLKAQFNYVPNGSFEQYDTCPNGMSFLTPSCKDWFTPISKMAIIPVGFSLNSWGSSDYYNNCSSIINVQIPLNFVGYQFPKDGNAYSGFLLAYYTNAYTDSKEYIEVKLKNNLIKGKKYCIDYYYSATAQITPFNYYPLEIGALFTDTLVYRLSGINTQQPQNIYAIPQVSQQLPLVMDTVNWIKVSGSFIAKGGEQYLTIGNFQNTDTLSNKSVYVYIDDVKLYYCGPDTIPQPIDSMTVPNIFTPNGDGYNDKFEYVNQEQWEFETMIYNRWEVPVYNNKDSQNWDGRIDGNLVSSGVYFYIIKAKAIKTGEIRVYRGTVSVMY